MLIESESKQEMILDCFRNVLNSLNKQTILSYFLRNCKRYLSVLIISIGFISLLSIITSTYSRKDESNEPDIKKEDVNSVKKRLPDFFIVGVKKSGTTTLGKTIKCGQINKNKFYNF